MRLSTDYLRGDSANLDLLRSLAVIFVVISHLPFLGTIVEPYHYHLQTLGLLGVLIFFVHTCLVLMLSLERQAGMNSEWRASQFYIRRAFRIYPLSIVAVLVVSVLTRGYDTAPSYSTILSNLLLIQNLNGKPSIPPELWSLPFEVQMYLVLPALYLLATRAGKAAPRQIGLLWVASGTMILLLWRLGLNYHLFKYLPCFLPGVMAFTLRKSVRELSPWALFLYVGLVAVLLPCAVTFGAKENFLAWPVCLVLGLIIPRCREIGSKFVQIAGKVVARYSYGIYLVHGTCIKFAFHRLGITSYWLQFVTFAAATAVFSYLAYHWIEKPGIDLGRKLAERWERYGVVNKAVRAAEDM
jgi:peptidoglycan/LPS O-acetylase OafA/YrhL